MIPHHGGWLFLFSLLFVPAPLLGQAAIDRRIPPVGRAAPEPLRRQWLERLRELETGLARLREHPLHVDVEVFTKAVRWALEHDEFYAEDHFAMADQLLDHATVRLSQLKTGSAPWAAGRGLVVRGYRSAIDGSVQPYGLVIPQQLDLSQPVPLYVWLHGRGDKITDLHFIHRRLRQTGQVAPDDAIVLHPFGRHCVGFKSAGEIDVLDAVASVVERYRIDTDRIVLMGFSMGGAGAWHLGAHYADRWCAVHAGAGFAETARYNRLQPADYPPQYEQQLWGLYDVPGYVRNLFNIPVVAYSGENDRQIQAARVMEQAYASHDRRLTHLIGPGMGHKYHPDSLREILNHISAAVARGRPRHPRQVFLQTRTLQYADQYWVHVRGLERHWRDARVDARIRDDGALAVDTVNVTHLELDVPADADLVQVVIDGESLEVPPAANGRIRLVRNDRWQPQTEPDTSLRKRPGLQGPIDDALLAPFLLVTPTGPWSHDAFQKWVELEIDHFRARWKALMRGQLRERRDVDVSERDLQQYHLLTWGDPHSNQLLRRMVARVAQTRQPFPVRWPEPQRVVLAGTSYDARYHVPVCCYPSPLQPNRYLVLNSGLTFREDHDRTNSLQNPKLPDWAVLDIRQPPSGSSAGRVVAADFFDERWLWGEAEQP